MTSQQGSPGDVGQFPRDARTGSDNVQKLGRAGDGGRRASDRRGPHIAPDAFDEDVGLREILAAVQRRAGLLAAIVAVAVGLMAGYLFLVTPRYTAEALVMVQPDTSGDFATFSSVVEGLPGDRESVRSEAIVLSSRGLAGDVVDRLGLTADREFSPDLRQGETAERSAVITRFQERLDVEPIQNSRVINVRFTSSDPDKAARITNTLLQEYQASRLELKADVTRGASAWLEERIEELRADIADKEAVLEDLREEFDLVDSDGVSLASRELLELNSQLVMARTEQAEVEARLGQVEELQARARAQAAGDGDPDADPLGASFEVLQSPLIQRLREQEAQVQRRVAELSSELGPMHPRMIQLKAEAQDLRDRIDGEVSKIVAGLRNQAEVARTRVRTLSRNLDDLKETVQDGNRNAIRIRAIEREAEASRQMLTELLSRDKQIMSEADEGFQRPDTKVISYADAPNEPSYPRKGVMLGLSFVSAFMIGLVAIFVLEILDDGFRSLEQIEQATGVPGLGFMPLVRTVSPKKSIPEMALDNPGSALAESVRTLGWTLQIMHPDDPPRTILLTSSVAGEGKTTVANLLALVQGQSGKKVLLIDADVRRPTCHRVTGIEREPGLTDLLSGEIELEPLLAHHAENDALARFEGVSVIPAGSATTVAANLLGSDKMARLLDQVRDQYDMVVIDSPPVTISADALLLSRIADTTVLAVGWGQTKKKSAAYALKRLAEAGASISGALLTKVDLRKGASYSYGDASAYGRDLEKYYQG